MGRTRQGGKTIPRISEDEGSVVVREPASPRQVRYGFNVDGSENPAEKALIKEIVVRRAKGESARDIAGDLQRRGVRSKRGGFWWPATVDKIAKENERAEPSVIEEFET